MDLMANDDELLLMELERRDGIYSFIFHELEANKLQTELQSENQSVIKQIKLETKEVSTSKEKTTTPATTASFNTAKLPVLTATSSLLTSSTSSMSYSYGDCYIKSSTNNFGKSWQTQFNFQFPMSASTHSSFQQFCSLHTFNVRRAKTPFSHIHAPLVRNRRHELKQTKEYKNFVKNLTEVVDLRQLFPLDPDVHAPFTVESENANCNSQYFK